MARFDRMTENRVVSAVNDVEILLNEENELEDGERRLALALRPILEALEALNNDAGERMEQAAARYGRVIEVAAERAAEDDVPLRENQRAVKVPAFGFYFPAIVADAKRLQAAKGEAAIIATLRGLARRVAQQAKTEIAFVRSENRLISRDARRQQLPKTTTNRRGAAGLSGWRWS